jgi:hypothetical protein
MLKLFFTKTNKISQAKGVVLNPDKGCLVTRVLIRSPALRTKHYNSNVVRISQWLPMTLDMGPRKPM